MDSAGSLLIEQNSDFLAMVAQWERDGYPFLGLADWFYERGMDGQGAGWQWAATKGLCPLFRTPMEEVPTYVPRSYSYMWWSAYYSGDYEGCLIPRELLDAGSPLRVLPTPRIFPTFSQAIAWFLDRWNDVYGSDANAGDQDKFRMTIEAVPLPLVHSDFSFPPRPV